MRILLIGGGGREHALAWRLAQCPSVSGIVCPGGNPGIARHARVDVAPGRAPEDWAGLAREERIDLVVVGPEAPLADGVADAVRARGIACFGPGAAGAALEASKAFTKKLLLEHGIPTARGEWFTDPAKALDFADSLGLPVVIKADGLAAGKGVTVATNREEARRAIEECLVHDRFGAAGSTVLVEECLSGPEVSLIALVDGERVRPLLPAEDYKRALDGDLGPNTGGMGACAPTPVMDEEAHAFAFGEILVPTVNALRARGIEYRGALFAGLMMTADGPKVLEYNCRFGDPETQVLMPLIEGDFAAALLDCAEGRDPGPIGFTPDHALTIVLASGGYPGEFRRGLPIRGLEDCAGDAGQVAFQSGTLRAPDGQVVTAGGRVACATAWGPTLAVARQRAENLCARIDFEGISRRRDIGSRALRHGG